jgi:hypothetical protein
LRNDSFEFLNNKPFNSLYEAQKCLQLTKQTILKYTDTFVLYKDYLFFSVDILNLEKGKLKKINISKPEPIKGTNLFSLSFITSFKSIIQKDYFPINYIPNYLPKSIWAYKVCCAEEIASSNAETGLKTYEEKKKI